MNETNYENDFVALVRVPRKWFIIFVITFSTVIIGYTLIELLTGWVWIDLGETYITRIAVLMTVTVGLFFIFSHLWEFIMLGYAKMFRDKVFAQGKVEGKAEGKAEGLAEGKAEGKAEVYREIIAWEIRKKEAEARGETFNEPLPIPRTPDTTETENL